jgi:hypothetical protein
VKIPSPPPKRFSLLQKGFCSFKKVFTPPKRFCHGRYVKHENTAIASTGLFFTLIPFEHTIVRPTCALARRKPRRRSLKSRAEIFFKPVTRTSVSRENKIGQPKFAKRVFKIGSFRSLILSFSLILYFNSTRFRPRTSRRKIVS